MDVLAWVLLAGLFLWSVWARTVGACRKLGSWVLTAVVVSDLLAFLLFLPLGLPVAVFAVLMWKLWFLFLTSWWADYGRLYAAPRWPRTPFRRGPGKRRPREFKEPMPWYRGPNSF